MIDQAVFKYMSQLPHHKELCGNVLIHNRQRAQVERFIQPNWRTTPAARDKITRLVSEI